MRHWLFALLFAVVPAFTLSAQEKFKWGGDREGGGPFIYEDDGKEVGFEVELVKYISEKLKRSPEFVQNDWDTLRDVLRRDRTTLDVALNGYEYRPEWEKDTPSTRPYFVYTLRLIAKDGDNALNDWSDLRKRKPDGSKIRVGVLRGSYAQKYMETHFGQDVEVVPTKEVDSALKLVAGIQDKDDDDDKEKDKDKDKKDDNKEKKEAPEDRRLDASVQDSPAAIYYVRQQRIKGLKVIGKPAGQGFYVILTRPEDKELRDKLNQAIREGLEDGTLRKIYQKYRLWEGLQRELGYWQIATWPPVPTELGKDQAPDTPEPKFLPLTPTEEGDEATPETKVSLRGISEKILKATWMTIALALCTMPIAILVGVLVAIGRVYGPSPLRFLLTVYVEVLRGTPLLIQIYFWFFVIPDVMKLTGWGPLIWLATLPPFVIGVLGLAINYSANEAENYRAGLLAVSAGQTEAGLALGLSKWQTIRLVVLPQAVRIVIPPVTNDFIALFKDTSICSMILITELTGLYYQYKSNPSIVLELTLTIAGIYLLISYPLSILSRRLEKK